MVDDPYAKYLTQPPGDDPYAKYLPQSAPAAAGNAYQPNWLDKVTNVAAHGATLGLDDVLSSAAGQAGAALGIPNRMPSMAQDQSQRAQFRSDVGPWASTAAEIAGYAAPGGVLGPIASAATKGPIMAGALEGALAGGATGATEGASGQDVTKDPWNFAENVAIHGGVGAGAGAAAGTVGAGLGKLVGAGMNKIMPPVGPSLSDITSQLGAAKTGVYGQGDAFQFHPNDIVPAYISGIRGLDLDQKANVSPGFQALLRQHVNLINGSPSVTAGNIDGLARGLQNAAQSPADGVLANRIAANLQGDGGVLGAATPTSGQAPGAARVWQRQANTANAAYQSASGLQDASQALNDSGASPASWALSQVKQFYPDPSPTAPYAAQRKALLDIANSGQSGQSAWNLMHAFDPLAEAGGFAVGGLPGAVGAGMGMHVIGKPLLGKALGAAQKAQAQAALRRAYPILTGVTPAQPPVDVGSLIRGLTVGAASPNY